MKSKAAALRCTVLAGAVQVIHDITDDASLLQQRQRGARFGATVVVIDANGHGRWPQRLP